MPLKIASTEEQYSNNAGLKKHDIVQLQNWLKKQPHLPSISELELIFFLHSCYYSIERTKETIDNFFTIKSGCPQLFGRNDPENFLPTLDEAVYAPLPMLTPEGYLVIYHNFINMNSKTYSFGNHVKYVTYIMHLSLVEKGIVDGIIVLIDLKHFSLAHLSKIPISLLKKAFVFVQEALPIRLKAIHYINCTSFIDKALAIVKPFIKTEILDISHFHTSNLETLYKYVPLKCLPKDYGGSVNSIADLHKSMKKLIVDNIAVIEEEESRHVDERKRIEKTRTAKNLFGIEGSFKKLDID